MFGLFKVLIVVVVVMVGVGFALERLPGKDGEKAADWGKTAAKYGMKGARGSMSLFKSFVKEVKEIKDKAEAEAPEG
jgi:hypothetical protein